MRRPFIAGNWKMNLNLASARKLVADLRAAFGAAPSVDIAIMPPAVYLFPMAKAVADSPIKLGAQNCWRDSSGAFTGEISAEMLRETGCTYVILGHSERRHAIGSSNPAGGVHGENDALIAEKCVAALGAGLQPIVCVGETLDQRDAGETESVLDRQIERSLASVDAAGAKNLVVAYEPVWAIGTGRTASPNQAQVSHAHIRGRLGRLFGQGTADGIRIQYGGSVKPENVVELMKCPDVDGALVGGASLKATDFAKIIEGCVRAKGM